MLITIKSPLQKDLCCVTIRPLSSVQELIQKAILEIDAGLVEEGVFLRPYTWDDSVGLDPTSRLPLVLNQYILDTLKKHPRLVQYETYKKEESTVECSFSMRNYNHNHNVIAVVYWFIIIVAIFKLIL